MQTSTIHLMDNILIYVNRQVKYKTSHVIHVYMLNIAC